MGTMWSRRRVLRVGALAAGMPLVSGDLALAQKTASDADPYVLDLSVEDVCYKSIEGKIEVSAKLPPRTGVIVTLGQSNISCHASGTYVAAHPDRINQLSIYDGVVYRAANPLIGCTAGPVGFQNGPQIAIADGLIARGVYDHVLLVPLANHVSTMERWNGPVGRRRLLVALRRLAAIGQSPSMFLLHNGEADHFIGTSAATYASNCQELVSYLRELGAGAPFFVALESIQSVAGAPRISDAIRTGQATAVSAALGMIQGPDWDLISSDRASRYDGVHFTEAGSAAAAALSVANIVQHVK